jgi:hypothetical protein
MKAMLPQKPLSKDVLHAKAKRFPPIPRNFFCAPRLSGELSTK